MSTDLICLEDGASILEAAQRMRDAGVGDVLVRRDERICGSSRIATS
jgi:hypothetical protein